MSKAPPGPRALALRAMREAKVERIAREAKAETPKPKVKLHKLHKKA